MTDPVNLDAVRLNSDLIDRLAHVIHDRYAARRQQGASALSWSDVDEDRRNAARGQARDIPAKLAAIGCIIRSQRDDAFTFTAVELEHLARREHRRWCAERTASGWTYGAVRDTTARRHPSLVPWEQLSALEKDKDRDAVRDIPAVLGHVGLGISRGVTARWQP